MPSFYEYAISWESGEGRGGDVSGGLSNGHGDGAADSSGHGGGDGLPGSERTNFWDIRGRGAPPWPIECDRGGTICLKT